MSNESQLAVQPAAQQKPSVVRVEDRGVRFQTLGEMQKFAVVAVNSGIYKNLTPEIAIITIQAGLELGQAWLVDEHAVVLGDA